MAKKKPRKKVNKRQARAQLTVRQQHEQAERKARELNRHRDILRSMIREAATTGLVTAIEHCSSFWEISDGYKKYIDKQIELHAKELIAAVQTALRYELGRIAHERKRKHPR